jgi:hypothetical protein
MTFPVPLIAEVQVLNFYLACVFLAGVATGGVVGGVIAWWMSATVKE